MLFGWTSSTHSVHYRCTKVKLQEHSMCTSGAHPAHFEHTTFLHSEHIWSSLLAHFRTSWGPLQALFRCLSVVHYGCFFTAHTLWVDHFEICKYCLWGSNGVHQLSSRGSGSPPGCPLCCYSGCPWMPLGALGCPWVPLVALGCPWVPLGALGCPWLPLVALGCPLSCPLGALLEWSKWAPLWVPALILAKETMLWVFAFH